MDSIKLHRKFHSKYDWAKWLDDNNNLVNINNAKYLYCGTQDDFKKEYLKNDIKKYFLDTELYLITTAGKSTLVSKTGITNEIEKFIGKKEIGIIDKTFKKLIYINKIGTYKKGLVIEYPKSRKREKGTLLSVGIHSNIYESKTKRIADAIKEVTEKLEKKLNNDYGGNMEHLWIDLELVESHLKDKKPFSFRFQKRVEVVEYEYNVGHYSVAPDFEKLKILSEEEIGNYILGIIFESTQILIDKEKKLDGFDAVKFRADFLKFCNELGYLLD
jgi:hypothetical protein